MIAFATCAIIIYGVYWSKPKNVGAAITIMQFEGLIPERVLSLINRQTGSLRDMFPLIDLTGDENGSPIPRDAQEDYHGGRVWYIIMILGATIFGGIHIGAWNFIFPTNIELIFWRVASLHSTIFGPITSIIIYLIAVRDLPLAFIYFFLAFFYVIARLFILVETFRTLFYLPPLAYVSTWTANIPHFS